MHVITLGEPLHTRLQKSRFFFYSNNYWQAHSLVTTFNLVSECQKIKTPQYHRTWLQIHTVQKHYHYNGGVLARQTSTFNFQNISARKEVLVSAWTQTIYHLSSRQKAQRSAAVFTMWFHKKKKKDNVQAALNLKEHYTASTLVLYDSVVDAFYKGVSENQQFSHINIPLKHVSCLCYATFTSPL